MSIHTFSSRNFTRDVSAAKRAANDGPVFIIDHGRPAFALLKIEDNYQLAGQAEASLLDLMDAIPQTSVDFEFEAPRLEVEFRAAELGGPPSACQAMGVAVVTRNRADFSSTGIPLVNPFLP